MSLTQIKNPPFMRAPISTQPIDSNGWQTVKIPVGFSI
jgi:hypothetical protein